MKSFEYGYFEKFDTNLHGHVKNPLMSKYLSKDKYIYFDLKDKKQSIKSFEESVTQTNGIIGLIEIYEFGG